MFNDRDGLYSKIKTMIIEAKAHASQGLAHSANTNGTCFMALVDESKASDGLVGEAG